MITKIHGEAPFQVLTNNFSISPSQEGYTLQISADGKNYSNLFSVGANVTRLVTGVAANSYYRLLGNESDVSINWMKTCVTEGGGSGSGTTYTAGEYISIEQDVISVTGITPDAYLTSADTQNLASTDYVDAAITAGTQDLASQAYVDAAITAGTQGFATQAYVTGATAPIQSQLDDVERVTATALTELHDSILELSGATSGYATHAEVTAATQGMATQSWVGQQGFITSAYTGFTSEEDFEEMEEVVASALTRLDADVAELAGMMQTKEEVIASALTQLDETKVESSDVHSMVKISQAGYDALVSGGTVDEYTFYIITGSTGN